VGVSAANVDYARLLSLLQPTVDSNAARRGLIPE